MWWWLWAWTAGGAEAPLDAQAIAEAVWRDDLPALLAGTYDAGDLPMLALGLGRLRDPAALDRLDLLLTSPDPLVGVAAATALGWTPGGEGVARERLRVETRPEVRAALILALGARGGVEDVQRLVLMLGGGGVEARAATEALTAAAARGVAGVDEAAPALLACLGRPWPGLREAAAAALGQLKPQRLEPAHAERLLVQWRALPTDEARARLVPWVLLQQSGVARRSWVLQALGSSWRLTRAAVLRGLEGGDLDRQEWARLAEDEDPWVARIASVALGRGPVDPDAAVRARATAGQASAGERLGLVEQALGAEEARTRSLAAWALQPHLTPEERQRLGEASDPVVRELVVPGAVSRDVAWLWGRLARETAPAVLTALIAEVQRLVQAGGVVPAPAQATLVGLGSSPEWLVSLRARALLARLDLEVTGAPPLPGPPELERDLQAVRPIQGAVIETTAGSFRVSLDPSTAPLAVSSFAATAETGGYDQLGMHRLIPGFIAQTGDPRGDGMGGLGWFLPLERSVGSFDAGALGMAAVDDEVTAGQWFVTLSDQPQLDGHHTRFGQVTAGMDVVTRLTPDDRIIAVHIERIRSAP